MSIAQNIRHYRELKGLTLDEFSAQSGLSISDCIRIEAGQRPLSADEITKVCHVLNITADDLCSVPKEECSHEGESVVISVNELQSLLGMMKD